MKPSDIREMTLDDINLKLKELSKELFNIKFQHATGRLDDTSKIAGIRKNIARMKTIVKEKGLGKRV